MDGELPEARLRSQRPADWVLALRGQLSRWARARGRWLAPRILPLLVTALGTMAVLGFTWFLARATFGTRGGLGRPSVIYLVRVRSPETAPPASTVRPVIIIVPATHE